jgi:hypothetical protein
MRLHHLSILRSCGAGKPQSTCSRSSGTLSRKNDTKSDPYPNYFKSPFLHFVSCLFILQRTTSDQLKTRGSVHSMTYWKQLWRAMCGATLPTMHAIVNRIVHRVKYWTPQMETLPLLLSSSGTQYWRIYSLIGSTPPLPPVKVAWYPRRDKPVRKYIYSISSVSVWTPT